MLPFINLKQMNNFLKFIMFVSIALTFVLAFYTLHDLQTAEGAGLYLSITFSQPTRTICDIIVDVAGMFLFFIAIFLPTIMLKHKSVESFFRLFSIYLAFMPIVHPGNVVHLLNAFQNLSIRTNLSDGALLKYLFQDLSPIFGILKVFLPFLFLVYTANRLTHTQKTFLNGFSLYSFCYYYAFAYLRMLPTISCISSATLLSYGAFRNWNLYAALFPDLLHGATS